MPDIDYSRITSFKGPRKADINMDKHDGFIVGMVDDFRNPWYQYYAANVVNDDPHGPKFDVTKSIEITAENAMWSPEFLTSGPVNHGNGDRTIKVIKTEPKNPEG